MFLGFEPINETIYSLGDAHDWPHGGILPPNTPYCGFTGDNPVCAISHRVFRQYILAVIIPLALIVVICASVVYIVMRSAHHFAKILVRDQDRIPEKGGSC